ncbi:hypothetical protein ON010_g12715 [Phytophthora cinnamomi]|nr:hypothetical protein ON010_g12715 [Phytophthora cinnamomi]
MWTRAPDAVYRSHILQPCGARPSGTHAVATATTAQPSVASKSRLQASPLCSPGYHLRYRAGQRRSHALTEAPTHPERQLLVDHAAAGVAHAAVLLHQLYPALETAAVNELGAAARVAAADHSPAASVVVAARPSAVSGRTASAGPTLPCWASRLLYLLATESKY